MAVASEAISSLQRDGYVVLHELLDAGEVEKLRTEIVPLLEATPHGRSDFEGVRTRRVYNLLAKAPSVHPLVEHPAILELVREHLGPPGVQLSIAQAIEILPGENAQQLHTDDLPFAMPKPHQPIVCNTMWALTPFTRANGATRLAPSSRGASQPPPEEDCVHAELSPGSVLVWDGSMWHGGGANTTEESRIGLAINFNANWLRQQENQYLAVPAEMVHGMSETLRSLIGYEMCGVLGAVDGRHPAKGIR